VKPTLTAKSGRQGIGSIKIGTKFAAAVLPIPRSVQIFLLTSPAIVIVLVMAHPNPGLTHLSNALATPGQLSASSSSIDGVPSDLEASIRCAGAQLTQAAGVLLHLSQDIIAQAIVIFTRFWLGADGGSLRIYSVKVSNLSSAFTRPIVLLTSLLI
jgi:hypothetical protein